MNAQHTPTPWTHGFHDGTGVASDTEGGWILAGEHPAIEHPVVVVRGGQDEWGVSKGVTKAADAAHIVKCVNAHDALVAALKALLIVAEHGECEAMHPDVADNMARAALAAAGEMP